MENDARRWQQQLSAARIAWSNLSLEELRRCAGDAAILAALIQVRYGVPLEDAESQVEAFFARSRRFFTVHESLA